MGVRAGKPNKDEGGAHQEPPEPGGSPLKRKLRSFASWVIENQRPLLLIGLLLLVSGGGHLYLGEVARGGILFAVAVGSLLGSWLLLGGWISLLVSAAIWAIIAWDVYRYLGEALESESQVIRLLLRVMAGELKKKFSDTVRGVSFTRLNE